MIFSALFIIAQSIKNLVPDDSYLVAVAKSNVLLLLQQPAGLGDETMTQDQLKLIAIVIVIFAFLAIFGLVFVVRSYRELKLQYGVIEAQHKEIADKNEELAFKNESLEELNMAKNNTISVVAHDFKAPLGNIQGLVELIKLNKETLTDEQLNYLDLLKKVSQDTSEMVDVMLDVHRIEEELHELTLHNHDIVKIINKAIALHEPAALLKKVKISLESEVETFNIDTDKQYFHQIISNILQNAIDFSPKDSTVIISLTENKNSVSIKITDEGPGISESDQKRLFSGYQKLDGEGNEAKTVGIGLVIVLRLLEKLHGKIDVKSEEGKGTTFVVELFT